jgi:hypothetical protein
MMATDEPGLTPAEQRATAALTKALRDPETEARIALRARTWLVGASAGRRPRVRWALAAAATLVVVAVAGAVLGVRYGSSGGGPTETPTPIPTLPGSPGRFDNGEFSFDYPTDWQVLAVDVPESCYIIQVAAVIGVGSWAIAPNESLPDGAVRCGVDAVEVPAGGIVVRLYWRAGGPAPVCWSPAPTPNASAGPNPVVRTEDGDMTSWEFARAGAQFGWPNNPIFEIHTSDPGQLAKAQAMVASFRWGPGAAASGPDCSPAT